MDVVSHAAKLRSLLVEPNKHFKVDSIVSIRNSYYGEQYRNDLPEQVKCLYGKVKFHRKDHKHANIFFYYDNQSDDIPYKELTLIDKPSDMLEAVRQHKYHPSNNPTCSRFIVERDASVSYTQKEMSENLASH